MATKQTRNIKITERHIVITPKARASFPNLFKARSFQNNPDEKKDFGMDLIFDPKQIEEGGKGKGGKVTPSLKQAYRNACIDKWGPDKAKWPKFKYGFSDVFKDGDEIKNAEGEPYSGYEGKIIVKAKSSEKYPPKVFDRSGQPSKDESLVYGGCYVQAKIIARPYDFAGNRGVSFKLYEVIFREDGERFGGIGGASFDVEEADLDAGDDEENEDDIDDSEDF